MATKESPPECRKWSWVPIFLGATFRTAAQSDWSFFSVSVTGAAFCTLGE